MYHSKFLLFICLFALAGCSKTSDVPRTILMPPPADTTRPAIPEPPEQIGRELSPLAKKLLGRWALLNFNPAPGDFWEFKDVIIDSLSTGLYAYRQYTDSVKQSWCGRQGQWYEKDSIIYGTCVPDVKVVKLTEDTLIFRYTYPSPRVYIDYFWKRIR